MPNPSTGVGNPYTRQEVLERLRDTLARGEATIAHVGCTVGASIGVTSAAMPLDDAAVATQAIIDAGKSVRDDVIYLSHGGPIATPADAAFINETTYPVGIFGASSLERMAVEQSPRDLTREFKAIPVKRS